MPLDSNLKSNFCFFRLPNRPVSSAMGFCSYMTLSEPEGNGFLISKFYPDAPLTFIPAQYLITLDDVENLCNFLIADTSYFPDNSTPVERYMKEVNTFIQRESAVPPQLEKGVAARCVVMNEAINPVATFKNLCHLYPRAFVFIFHTPESGLWMGASPECLIERNGTKVSSDVLAGTKFSEKETWSVKNIEEHDIVARYIADIYSQFCSESEVTERRTINAGPVWHLQSRVSGHIKDERGFLKLIQSLSPTPALCGYPKKIALDLINDLEDFKRDYYGGFCGPYNAEKANLFVNLRSGRFQKSRLCLYIGGGIMKDSDVTEEWNETEKKANTMLNAMVFKNNNSANN